MDEEILPFAPVHPGLPFADGAAGALLDAGGRIIGWTPTAEELFSLPAARVLGRRLRELLKDPGAGPGPPSELRSGAWSGEAVVRTGEGRELKVEFQVLPLSDVGPSAGASTGQPARYFVLAAPARTADRWRQDRAFTRELFLQDRLGLAVFDEELRLVRTNTHLLPYTGLPQDLRGHRLGDFLQAKDAAAVEQRLRDVLRTGLPLVRVEETVRTVEDPGRGAVMAISAFRLQAPDGQVFGVTALFTDVTEARRAGERLAVLQRATAAVGASLSVAGTAEDLAAALVPALADFAVVEIAEAVFTGEEPAPAPDGSMPLRRTAVAGRTSAEAPLDGPAGDTPDGSAGAPLDSVVLARPDDPAKPADPLTSMTVPLRARGSVLGRVAVHREAGETPYEAADLDLLREIAGHAALALDNARRYTREHRASVGLQRSLLPPSQAETVAVTTAGVYLPADTGTGVGGDWFDVIPLSSARVALVAGDVVGHGLAATATMGRLHTAVRTLADLDLEPDELLEHLDDLVSQLRVETDEPEQSDDAAERTRPRPDPIGATCLYAVYDPVSRRCSVASAGHPPPAVAAQDGTVTFVPVNPGPPLGVSGLPFEVAEVDVEPESIIALYTDGLIESRERDLDEGMAELTRRLSRPGVFDTPLRELGLDIVSARPSHHLTDDITLLLARTHVLPPEDQVVWPVAADPAAVADVREATARQLDVWGLTDLAFTTELVLSELVTNAITYAGGPVEVRLIRAGHLICEVSDPSATQPRMRRALLTDEGGRGLYLVAQLTTRWGCRYTRQGKTIWAEQEIPDGEGGGYSR
ncbi:SpoIIE family protein phosphatase [Streptomyces sp. NPDC050844]|uniref:SpoIIE family protein phosphatase n=1 Tax=Streptomyces sp. NPDC050844 TaxID=3155790 RepID=UPI0033F844C4